jgi:twinkle protein
MKEINGFKIDKYNQYDFIDGAKTATCPKCSHERKKKSDKCVKLDWETGFGSCYHCGESLQLHTYAKKETIKKFTIPAFKYTELSDKVLDWFEGRGISSKTLSRLKVTEGVEWMPQLKKEVKTINFKLVSGAEKILYNIDAIRTTKECVIVEGEIDALSFVEAEVFNVVSIPNGFNLKGNINLDYLDDYLDYFDNKDKIYLCLDNDAAGLRGKQEFVRRLGSDRCYIVDLGDCKDANEYLIEYGAEKLKDTLSNAELTPINDVVTLSDMSEELDDFWLNGKESGMKSGLKSLDDGFTMAFQQYTLVTGVPQSGKSEILDQMCIQYNLMYDCKVGYCSTENEPFIFHYDKIFQKIYGQRPESQEQINGDDVKDVKNHIANNFFHIQFKGKRYWLQDVLDKFAELVKRHGVRVFVIDPFNKVKLKNGLTDVNRYTEEYHILIDEFVKKYDVHLFLVAHPVKMTLTDTSSGNYQMPSAYNLKGGGEHFDMSYNIIGVNRLYDIELVHVKTLKVKFKHLGKNQHDSYFNYNRANGRYQELEFQPNDLTEKINPIRNDYDNWLTNSSSLYVPFKEPEVIQPNIDFDMEFEDPNY